MAGGGGVQHIGLQHGVVADARQGDPVVGQHIGVVLEVLAQLGPLRVLQQGLQARQHLVAVQLLGGPEVIVTQWHIGGRAGLHREGDADDTRFHVVQAGGFGVEGKAVRRLQLFHPGVKIRLTGDNRVLGSGGILGAGFARGGVIPGQQLLQPALEFQPGVPGLQGFAIRLGVVQILGLLVQFQVGLDGRQLVGEEGPLPLFLQLRRHALGAAEAEIRDLVQLRVDRIQPAQALQQGEGGLLADTGDARDVVHLVAHQGQQVDHPLRGNAELLLHTRDIQGGARHGIDQGDVGIHQLGHVLVAGGYDHRARGGAGLAGQSTDDVVGLHPGLADQRQAHGPHQGVDRLHLRAQLVGHGRAVSLVLLEQLVAEGLAWRVEYHHHRAVGVVPAQPAQHADHPLDRPTGFAPGRGQGWQRMESPVEVGGTVDQDQGRL